MRENTKTNSNIALLLSGGGARAAYQVGVLKAIASTLPKNHGLPFPIVSGTSAGAINSTALAVYASCYHLGVKKLERVWKNFNTSHVYRSDAMSVLKHLSRGFLAGALAEYANQKPISWFDNQPLRELLNKMLNLKRIDKNIMQGYLKALSVNASSYTTGDSVCFFQADKNIPSWNRSHRRGEKTLINVEHLMASAAIPLVFPAIQIRHDYYGDGSIHQLAPLSPPIHLGANKIFIIGMSQPKISQFAHPKQSQAPTTGKIAGHLLDTIFNEALNSDLERLTRVNQTISLLSEESREKSGLREVATYQISPSKNFNQIAHNYYDSMPLAIRSMLKLVGVDANEESSILSYLLFEKSYCSELIDLGFKDGLEQLTEIKAFLELE